MGFRGAFITGTVLSAAVTSAWSFAAMLTIGPPQPVRLGRSPRADYASLAAAATGSAPGLFIVVALIYTACFFVSGLRRIRRERAETRELEHAYADAEAYEHAAGWR